MNLVSFFDNYLFFFLLFFFLTFVSPKAMMVVLINMLVVLKLAPFEDDADDYLSFLTSFQMLVTLIAGLLLKTDNPNNPTYDSDTTGIIIIAVNSLGMIALFISILCLHPAIRRRINSLEMSPEQREYMQREIRKDLAVYQGVEQTLEPDVEKKGPDEHEISMAAAMKLYRTGKISTRTAKKVTVVQGMCQEGKMTVIELVHLLRKWNKTTLISDKELPHILAIYNVGTSKSSSTKVVPILEADLFVPPNDVTAEKLALIRKQVSVDLFSFFFLL